MDAIFFFSSRRRHTRLQGDWSSDVCSSDLGGDVHPMQLAALLLEKAAQRVSDDEVVGLAKTRGQDRKSTRLNSSHLVISYAVFCLKKKKNHQRLSPSQRSHALP